MIKAVIFDLDDTLLESREVKWAHHRTVAKKFYNINLSDDTLLLHWGKPFSVLLPELYQNSDTLENMVKANASMREDFLKKVYPGSVEVVAELLDRGLKVGLLSAANKEYILDDMERLNFPVERFAIIQGPQDTLVHKPHPDVFIPVLDKLKEEGIKKEEIVYVGDSLDDLKAATEAGINFIAVTTGLFSEEDFRKNGAKIIIKEIKELPNLIKNI